MKRIAILLILSISHTIAFAQSPLKPIAAMHLSKFTGTWYLISRLPNDLDKNLTNVSVNYLQKKQKVKETFMGDKKNGKSLKIKSTLTYTAAGTFKGPFGKNYLVIKLGSNYEYFVMATEDRKHLWIMGRSKTLDNNTYNSILSGLVTLKYDTTKLVMMVQK